MENYSILEHKVTLLKNLIFIVGSFIFIMSFYRFYEMNYVQFVVDILFFIVLLISYLKLKKDKNNFTVIARFILSFSILAAFFLLVSVQESPIRFIWFSSTVYLMFYLLDKREGWYWALTVAGGLITLYLYDRHSIGLDKVEFFTWLFNMFIILVIVNWYENMKELSTKRLLNVQYILSSEVKAKTVELQALNSSLENKVASEIKKNNSHMQLMFQHTRHAQMGEMISMIAHQWRQPLSAISATANALVLKNERGSYERDYFDDRLRKITAYSQHLSVTIDDFRNFFQTNKVKEKTRLEVMISEALSIIQVALENRNIQVILDYKYNKVLDIHTNELKQVVLNLLKNAEDALLENKIKNPKITIRTFSENNKAVLSVEDNAGGIDESIIDKIFDLYFSTKLEREGTGLGLYMSKTIIEEHCGGKLSVSNGSDGAVFRIELRENL